MCGGRGGGVHDLGGCECCIQSVCGGREGVYMTLVDVNAVSSQCVGERVYMTLVDVSAVSSQCVEDGVGSVHDLIGCECCIQSVCGGGEGRGGVYMTFVDVSAASSQCGGGGGGYLGGPYRAQGAGREEGDTIQGAGREGIQSPRSWKERGDAAQGTGREGIQNSMSLEGGDTELNELGRRRYRAQGAGREEWDIAQGAGREGIQNPRNREERRGYSSRSWKGGDTEPKELGGRRYRAQGAGRRKGIQFKELGGRDTESKELGGRGYRAQGAGREGI